MRSVSSPSPSMRSMARPASRVFGPVTWTPSSRWIAMPKTGWSIGSWAE
jgi:hypothetical protein